MPARIKMEDPEPVQPVSVDAMDIDNDDEICREIDVYLSPTLCQQMYLLQFPLQHTQVSSFTEARIKPRHGLVEIDQPLPEGLPPRHYETGEQNLSWVKKRSFASHTVPVDTHMCMAKLVENKEAEGGTRTELHMVPLQHICQMRPSIKHIGRDLLDEQNKTTEQDMEDLGDETKMEKKPLLFKRKESERATHARKSSYAYKMASEDAEEWHALQVCGGDADSMEYQNKMDLVACPKPKQHVVKPSTNNRYIESLNYMPLSKETTPISDPSSLPPLQLPPTRGATEDDSAAAAAVVTHVTGLLRHGWPVPFSVLKDRFGLILSGNKEQLLFRALSVCAVMVRGNFCLHSRFVANLAQPLQHARTLILFLLQTRGSIQRERLRRVYDDGQNDDVTQDKLNVLLQQVARQTDKGWELRVEDDLNFVALHPEQSELHRRYWERQNQSVAVARLLRRYDGEL